MHCQNESCKKRDLVEMVKIRRDIPSSVASKIVDDVIESLKELIKRNRKVMISNFGSFESKEYKGKKLKSKTNGEIYEVDSYMVLKFTPSKQFLKKIRELRGS